MINLANLAKVVIWAEDKTKEGVDSAQRNLQGLHNEVDALQGKWKALGALLGIGTFALMVKQAVDAQAKMKDLAEQAGMTVEQFSRFEEVGRTSGVGLDGIASAVQKLSKSLIEAKDPTSAAAQALKSINLSWEALKGLSPDEALIRIAKAMAEYGGGLEKNAAMMALFSRGGAQFQTLLNEIAEAQSLTATTSQAQADAADFLKDSLEKLQLRSESFWRMVASEMVPHLNSLLEVLLDAPTGSNSASEAFGMLGESLKYLGGFALSAWMALKDMGDGIGAVAAKVVMLLRGDFAGVDAITEERNARAAANEEAYNRMWERLRGNLKEEKALKSELKQLEYDPNAGKDRKAYEAATLKLNEQIAVWREKERLGRALTESEKELADIEAGKYSKLLPAQAAELKAKAALWKVEQDRAIGAKADLDARLKEAAALAKGLDALNARVDAARLEAETYGMTASQIELVATWRAEEQLAQLRGVEGAELQVKALELEIARRRELVGILQRSEERRAADAETRRAIEDQVRALEEFGSRGGYIFADLAMHGRAAFKTLKEELKAFGRELLALVGKKWILSIAGSLMGGDTGGVLAARAASSGAGSMAGSALNWAGSAASSYFGYGGGIGTASQFFGAASGSIPSAAIGADAVAAGVGIDTMAAGAGEAIYSALASIGPYGWIAIAVIAIAAWLSSRGGGPKTGGSFLGAFDSAGNFTGSQSVPGTDNGRFFTPSQGDEAIRTFTEDVASGFFTTLRRLGGTTQGASFGFGFDRDPNGTADSRVSAMVRDASGNVVYNSTITAGRDDEDFNRAVALQTRRAILAGLQASGFPEAMAAIFDSIDVASATAEQIDGVLRMGEAMHTLLETLDPINVEELLATSGRTAIESWREQGAQLRELAANTTLTVESLGQLTQATGQYRAQAAALILQFEAARRNVDAGINSTIRDMRFSTLDRQGQYDMLRGEASTIASTIAGMQDAQQIADAINQVRTLSTQAFGMLSDEERRSMLPQFEAGLREAQREADERLVALRQQVKEESDAQLAAQRQIVTDMATAATRIESAATTLDGAANRIADAEISVNVHAYGGDAEVQAG